MKKFLVIFILLCSLSLPARADVYSEQLNLSGIDSLPVPEDALDFFNENDISITDSDWINKIRTGNIFTFLWDTLKTEGKTPVVTGASVLGCILLLSAVKLFSDKNDATISFIGTSVCAGAVLLPIFGVITAAVKTLKAGAEFMLAFVPIYTTVIAASGKPLTGTVSGSLLLGASEGVFYIAANTITPLIGAYLAVCICGNLSPAINLNSISEFLKKCASWIMGLVMTVYVGLLGIQTTVNAAADTLAVRTGRFMLGSFIPVAGGAVSEALTTVSACMKVLHSSVGVYGILILALVLLPSVLQLLLWRAVLLLCGSAATLFDNQKTALLLRAADSAVSFILGIMLICSVAFILSLTVVIKAGN